MAYVQNAESGTKCLKMTTPQNGDFRTCVTPDPNAY